MIKENSIKLGEIAEFRNGVNYNESNFGRGIKIINVANFKDYSKPNYEELGEINPNELIKEDDLLQNGDIVFVRSNGNKNLIGRTLYIDEIEENLTYSAFCIRTRFKSEECNPKFYSYLFKTSLIRQTLSTQGNGTNISNLNQKILNNLSVPKPSIDKQNKITSILSKYDELIENNLKRIKLLEESAELIYKEWFINLRFPGYEKCNIVDGIPDGWSIKFVKEFGEVITGKTPSTKKNEYYGGSIPFVKTPDMNNMYTIKTIQKLTEEGAKSQEKKYVPKNTILVSCIGTVGVVSLTSELSQFNQQINGLVLNKENYIYYMYFKLKFLKGYLEALGSSGSTMLNVNKYKFENIEILKPPKELLDQFMTICKPIFNNVLNIQHQTEKLKEARDILIPRLISGRIEV
ncbi:MAG: restriction endonuclease subunit S [Paraclostridium bifermentans]|uniref:restriction endonuclease subunit S n=1 Tax=Paraclostridium bifermentans TaxID=1490 RepID=UPI00241C3AD6|nr:restriction endonuclease subunit S [Paraclostridium bifermentans]MBS5953546.1 restriction endonuclease subunit S [Paraclostridium bifermentans]